MTRSNPVPRRGEIWLVNLDPTVGHEIQKTRPAVVVSTDAISRLPLKLIAPITGWQTWFADDYWHVRLDPTERNGLGKISAVDTLQLRGIDHRRFITRLGELTPLDMEEIAASIAIVVEHS